MRMEIHSRRSNTSFKKESDSSRSSSIQALYPSKGNSFVFGNVNDNSFAVSPKTISTRNDTAVWSFVPLGFMILILFWIYYQYQLIPSHDNDNIKNTKTFHGHQNIFIQSSNFKLFTDFLHSKCRYGYSHNLSNIGDINIVNSNFNDVPFLQFLSISDYGILTEKYTNNNTDIYQNQMLLLKLFNTMNQHLNDNTHFVISAGDHFYDNNVNDVKHPRWDITFDKFDDNRIFLAAVGNKDWENEQNQVDVDTINAQIDKTYWSKNWCLPRLYYTLRFIYYQNEITKKVLFKVRIIVLDTTSYLKERDFNSFDYLANQYEWLYNVLEDNKEDDYIFVVGHHPFEQTENIHLQQRNNRKRRNSQYTFEELKNENVWRNKMNKILELLLKYPNVKIYISGHHHVWRVCSIGDSNDRLKLYTIVTGSAGRHDYRFNNPPPHMLAGGEQETFGKFTIYKNVFKIQIIDKNDNVLFTKLYHKHKD